MGTLKKNYLLVFSFIVYLVTMLLLLSELDRQYYQVEKESIIKYNFRVLFPHDTRKLQEVSRKILVQHEAGGVADSRLAAEWRELAQAMLDGEGCVFRIRIVPKDEGELLAQRDDGKFQRLNGFANTLFYRNFQNVVSYEIADAAGIPWIGLLSFHYTTPGDYAPILSLTRRYRLWALLIFAVITAGYAVVVRHLILPIKRVVERIDAASASAPKIMPKPSSLLEKAYNNLARDAILLRMGQSIRNLAAGNPTFDRSDLLARVPRLLVELLDYRAVLLFDLSADESGAFSVSGCVEADDGSRSQDYRGYCLKHVFAPDQVANLVGARCVAFGECVVCDISQPEDRPHLTCLAVFLSPEIRHPTPDLSPSRGAGYAEASARAWRLETVERLSEQLREILAAFDLQRRYIRNERSRANINLARNLGHDLTNIIATSKLDIRTVMKVLDGTGPDGAEADTRRPLLLDAVRGLLNNTRLLQEVVNIYRSFSYIHRPRFETAPIHRLLDEILEVFSLSLPARIVLRKNYADEPMECTVEPRLLKLAVFNLLTNAVDAVKQNQDPARGEGAITVSTRGEPGTGQVCITVRDNGTGIRTGDGRLASQAEIDKIFRYGVSTKTEDGGEGLGLSWVWTIVEEFHHGRVQARNHPDGGAEFTVWIG